MNKGWMVLISAAWTASVALAYVFGGNRYEQRVEKVIEVVEGKPVVVEKIVYQTRSEPATVSDPIAGGNGDSRDHGPEDWERSQPINLLSLNDQLSGPMSRAEIREALLNSDPIDRMTEFARVLRNLDGNSITDALEEIKNLPDGYDREREMSLLLYAWAKFDGERATHYVKDNVSHPWQQINSMQKVLSGWATTDPDAALDWAMNNEPEIPEEWKRRMQQGREWRNRGSGGSGGEPDRPADDRKDNPYLVGIISGVAKTDARKAADMVELLPYGRNRGTAVSEVLDSLYREGSDLAMDWASNISDPLLQRGVASRVADKVARTDPVAAADWSLSLTDETVRSEAMEEAVERWARSDLDAAADWLTNIPAEPARDDSVRTLVQAMANDDPKSALVWAGTITDEKVRHDMLERVADRWMQRDPAAAKAFLGGEN